MKYVKIEEFGKCMIVHSDGLIGHNGNYPIYHYDVRIYAVNEQYYIETSAISNNGSYQLGEMVDKQNIKLCVYHPNNDEKLGLII